jgi:hypothetical protein
VSPIEEKAVLAGIARKEVGAGGKRDVSPQSSLPRQPASPPPASVTTTLHENNGPREIAGSMPPPRHEVASDGEITRVNQFPGPQAGYQESRQGQWGYAPGGQGAYEVDGRQRRQELPGQPQVYEPQQPQQQGGYGQQYGGTYELGTGR